MNNKFIIKASIMTLAFGLMAGTYSFASTTGTVTGNRVNVRTGPSTDTTVITQYNVGNKVTILAKEGDWYKITLADDQIAYMFGEYIKEDPAADETAVVEEAKAENSDIRTELVNYAKQFLGNPYRYGGTSLTNGTDCSGFTQQIFKNFGYSINRSSSSQFLNGTSITGSLLPGDLVFFGYSGKISHVGIYIGENKIIHASTSSTGIIINGLYDRGNKPFIGSRRII